MFLKCLPHVSMWYLYIILSCSKSRNSPLPFFSIPWEEKNHDSKISLRYIGKGLEVNAELQFVKLCNRVYRVLGKLFFKSDQIYSFWELHRVLFVKHWFGHLIKHNFASINISLVVLGLLNLLIQFICQEGINIFGLIEWDALPSDNDHHYPSSTAAMSLSVLHNQKEFLVLGGSSDDPLGQRAALRGFALFAAVQDLRKKIKQVLISWKLTAYNI